MKTTTLVASLTAIAALAAVLLLASFAKSKQATWPERNRAAAREFQKWQAPEVKAMAHSLPSAAAAQLGPSQLAVFGKQLADRQTRRDRALQPILNRGAEELVVEALRVSKENLPSQERAELVAALQDVQAGFENENAQVAAALQATAQLVAASTHEEKQAASRAAIKLRLDQEAIPTELADPALLEIAQDADQAIQEIAAAKGDPIRLLSAAAKHKDLVGKFLNRAEQVIDESPAALAGPAMLLTASIVNASGVLEDPEVREVVGEILKAAKIAAEIAGAIQPFLPPHISGPKTAVLATVAVVLEAFKSLFPEIDLDLGIDLGIQGGGGGDEKKEAGDDAGGQPSDQPGNAQQGDSSADAEEAQQAAEKFAKAAGWGPGHEHELSKQLGKYGKGSPSTEELTEAASNYQKSLAQKALDATGKRLDRLQINSNTSSDQARERLIESVIDRAPNSDRGRWKEELERATKGLTDVNEIAIAVELKRLLLLPAAATTSADIND